jgi:hypothetical protein
MASRAHGPPAACTEAKGLAKALNFGLGRAMPKLTQRQVC